MKQFITLFIAFFFTVGLKPLNAQLFYPEWDNNYSGWLGGWYTQTSDVYLRGNFEVGGSDKNFYNLLNFHTADGWAMLLGYSSGYFSNRWSNGGNGTIGDWTLNNDDKYVTLFQGPGATGNTYLLAINSRTRHSQVLTFVNSQYPYWNSIWGNDGSGWIGGWYLNDDDRFLEGNFDGQSTNHELVAINTRTGWLSISELSGGSFVSRYNNAGSGSVAGWIMRSDDLYLTADLDGNGKAELICINRGTNCAAVFKYENNNFTSIWWNNCNSQIGLGGWTNFNGTKIVIYDFDNDSKEEIMFVNPSNSWCTIKRYSSVPFWPDLFCNYGNGWIDGWYIGVSDNYIAGNFGLSGNRNLLFINPSNSLSSLTRVYIPSVEDGYVNEINSIEVYPNPFNINTNININLQQAGNVRISIFDILGREIKLISNSFLKKGFHTFSWNGIDKNNNIVSSGHYFLRVSSDNFATVKKLIISK